MEDKDLNLPTEKQKKLLIVAGLLIGILLACFLFYIPNEMVEEGLRITIIVVIILFVPNFVESRFHFSFKQGRTCMGIGFALCIIVEILRKLL